VHDISLDAWVSDIETVVDAIGDEGFRLLGSVAVNRVVGVDPWRNVPPANPGNVG